MSMITNSQKKMPIMEIFGPTVQGEGMVIGRKTMFVRTGGCDYSCAWCDSAFTWNGEQKSTMMTVDEVFNKLKELGKHNFNHVTISGGNPALIGEPMQGLINNLHAHNIKVGLETQGSKWQDWFYNVDDLTISPKPPSSGMKTDFRILTQIVQKLDYGRVNFSLKVVVFNDEDFEYAKFVHEAYPDIPFYLSVGNEDAKEEGDISGRLLQKLDWLWEKVLNEPLMNDARPLPQLHTLVWANKRGV